MAHVVMQAAQFPSRVDAERAEVELRALFDAYVKFEETDPSPWRPDRVAPPLVEFGLRHGVDWPLHLDTRFHLKDQFRHAAWIAQVDRMLFFWGGGFDLGGPALAECLRRIGAVEVRSDCHLVLSNPDPAARVAELVEFLIDEDFEGQFRVDDGEASLAGKGVFYSLTVVGPSAKGRLYFDDSGVQDWAFVDLLPGLTGEDPVFATAPVGPPAS